ncbi:major capsid protein [Bartonella australis AUST/NH1]|uniref:Major capsid protein n=1 Tax=Bartonella australis (strain Aust/NH1) TaxID=1094489 RepID=M1P4S6_BARAA|nr:phage capsid protein [Bartonella australis]AGF74860.1 major capsid protein [Bartonella australis AUST/NH1]
MDNTTTSLPSSDLTLADWAKRQDPNGKTPIIANLLSRTNEILQDAVYKEGNLPKGGERVFIRTGLPTVYWHALNKGIPSSKSTTTQVDEICSILEARSSVDKDLAMLSENISQFRLSEDIAVLNSMNQEQEQMLFHGDPEKNSEYFLGLAPRYSDMKAENGRNILDAGGRGSNNTSVYLVVWEEQTVYCHFPKGSKAGLIHRDLGEMDITDPEGGKYRGYESLYQWRSGLVVKDWRYVVRIANIDIDDLNEQKGTQAPNAPTALTKLLEKAISHIPRPERGKPAFYMNRSVHEALVMSILDKSHPALIIEKGLMLFSAPYLLLGSRGVPLRRVDALLNTEEVVE